MTKGLPPRRISRTEKTALLANVAEHAAARLKELPPLERAKLFRGMSLIVEGELATRYDFAAFAIERAEEAQLSLFKTLNL